jgi:hypothetical protein
VAYPAGFDASVVAVGSTDPRDDRCRPEVCGYGPNYGPHIDLAAPGVSIPILWFADAGAIVSGAGTSFAAPMVAGAASLLLARFPALNADQVRDLLRGSAADGVGRPEEDAPGFDVYHGYGRLDAAGALALGAVVHFPEIVAPPLVRAAEGEAVAFEVDVRDADGDPVDSLWMERGSLPLAAAFTPSPDRTRGAFAWTPRYLDAGVYDVVFGATNPFLATARTKIEIVDVPDPPRVTAPAIVAGIEGTPVSFAVEALDPDGDPLVALTAEGLPDGAAFLPAPDAASGRFDWTPGYRQAGGYTVRFVVQSLDPAGPLGAPLIETGEGRTFVRIADGPDQAPIVGAPAAVEGAEGEPLRVPFSVDDPDGDDIVDVTAAPLPVGAGLTLDADHRAGTIDWTPGYDQAGAYLVVVSAASAHRATPVSEPVISVGSATIAISIAEREAPPLAAAAAPDPGDRVLRLIAAKPEACLRIEPVAGSFDARDVDPTSLRLRRADRDASDPIPFLDDKTRFLADRDRNGVEELGACVSKEALRRGLGDLTPGRHDVSFLVEGRLVTGESLRAAFVWTVVATGTRLAAGVSPSPLRAEGAITLRIPAPGPLRVRLFDVSGRLVRVLLDEARASAGYRDVPLDGRDARGRRLRSGIYFYRVETAGESFAGKIAISR